MSEPAIPADTYQLTLRPADTTEIPQFLSSVLITVTIFGVATIVDDQPFGHQLAASTVATLLFAAVRHWEARRRIPRGKLPGPPPDATIADNPRARLTPSPAVSVGGPHHSPRPARS